MSPNPDTNHEIEIDLARVGLEQVAYVRAASIEGHDGYAIHAADGRVIGFAESLPKAIGAILQAEMEPIPLH